MRAAPYLLCLALCACTQFPELDGTVTPDLENADFPDLVPLEPLLARTQPVVANPVQTTQALEARLSALRARARVLQGRSIVDSDTRARLRSTLN